MMRKQARPIILKEVPPSENGKIGPVGWACRTLDYKAAIAYFANKHAQADLDPCEGPLEIILLARWWCLAYLP